MVGSCPVTSVSEACLSVAGGVLAGVISDRLEKRASTCGLMLLLAAPTVSPAASSGPRGLQTVPHSPPTSQCPLPSARAPLAQQAQLHSRSCLLSPAPPWTPCPTCAAATGSAWAVQAAPLIGVPLAPDKLLPHLLGIVDPSHHDTWCIPQNKAWFSAILGSRTWPITDPERLPSEEVPSGLVA
ncbi:hypothetical protein P7K49_032566 [Saguinus oedipus]|uniref:Uncharacterized protein n=1 Tax=Saguinus oedipus TaxID=9490 RepID=A0ABQ9TYK7_SAGOE|nr:hypothetical protein P7K49_032566 [Saguinus oedipus]